MIALVEWEKLKPMHLDVLREIGNIGAGNSASALAELLNKRINMDVPTAGVINFKDILGMWESEEERAVCVNLHVTGGAPSTVLFLLAEESALILVSDLMGLQPGTICKLDEMGQSALQEVGNILTGSMLNAISSMTGLHLSPSVPAIAHDMLGAVLSAALVERGYFEDQVLLIETRFYDASVSLKGYFFLIPEEGSLGKIFNTLGINM